MRPNLAAMKTVPYVGIIAVSFVVAHADAQLTKFTPSATNSIILIDVAGLNSSALGQSQDWTAKHAENYAAGRTPFPPSAQTVMFAREIDPNGLHAVRREVAVLRTSNSIGFQRLAEVVGGKAQKIGSRSVVASPRGFLAALLDDKSVAAYYPADRQAFGRWLKNAGQAERAELSAYLARVTAAWPQAGQIMMALDLTEGVDEAAIEDELKMQKDIVKSDADAKSLAKAFSHIEGMRFTINVTDSVQAEWKVDFTESIAGAEQVLRPFLESAVKRIGETSLDLSKWSMTASSKSVTFKSSLTPEQLRGVLESIHSPILMGQSLSRTGAPDPIVSVASQNYFRSVNNIVQSLDRFADRLTDYNTAAVEYDRSASRIQRLSTANVDPEVVKFADMIASMLFAMSSTLRGVPREAAVQAATAWDDRFFRGPSYFNPGWNYPWRWGVMPPVYVGGGNPTSIAKGNIARAVTDEASQRRNDWLKIREIQRATNARMTNKYGVDFMQGK